MLLWPRLLLGSILRLLRSRRNLLLENLVLRQQVAVLKPRQRRPSLRAVVAQVYGDFFSLDEQIALIGAPAHCYSSLERPTATPATGTRSFGAIIAAVTGESCEAALDTYILRPFGLADTGYAPQTALIPKLASVTTKPGAGMRTPGVSVYRLPAHPTPSATVPTVSGI
jgi:hypothetical protein